MTSRYLFESVWLASCALAVAAPVNAGPTIFRILAEMNQYSPPMGLTEVSPGLFYFPSGSSLFSITTHGTTTLLEPLPIGALSPLVAGANGQFYSSSWGGYNGYYPYPGNVFSVAATGETVHVYAPQTLAARGKSAQTM